MKTAYADDPEVGEYEVPEIDHSNFVTEDDTPVDNLFCEKQMRLLTGALLDSWHPGVPFIAMANVGLYVAVDREALVPDVLVGLDVVLPPDLLRKEHRAWYMWLYGKSPDIVVELVSNKKGGELTRKLVEYARMRVPYYVVYDPEAYIQSEPLRCFELNLSAIPAEYRPMDKPLFPGIGLGLVCWDGLFEKQANPWVRWTDASGELIPTGDERAKQEATRANTEQSRANSEQVRANQEQARANTATARAETERSRADAETARAEDEKSRAEAEKTRADALAARLRALGVNPDE